LAALTIPIVSRPDSRRLNRAGVGQRKAPPPSIEQPLADLALELLDMLAHRGLRQPHHFGRALHVALAHDLGEGFQLTKGKMHI
jgi:hypothetical protein